MKAECSTGHATCGAVDVTQEVVGRKSEEQFAVEIAAAFTNAAHTTVRKGIVGVVNELTEAEAMMELIRHKYRAEHASLMDHNAAMLKDTRQFRVAMGMEFREGAKALTDVVGYFGRPETGEAIVRLRELCAVVEKVKELNRDGLVERLMEAVLKG